MAGELREHLRDRLAGALARRHRDEFDMRMGEQEPDEFLAGVTRGTDDGDTDGGVVSAHGQVVR